MTDERRHVAFCNSVIGISGKDILEIGGCVSPSVVGEFGPKSWTAIDINPRRFSAQDTEAQAIAFEAIEMSATSMKFEDATFDAVFSINCFEHIDDLETALSEMYRVLRPGGLLFTIFGPIWSSPVGHHTWVQHDGRLYHFNAQVFPDWHHLVKGRAELRSSLEEVYGAVLSEKICQYVYDSSDLNRVADGQYLGMVKGSDFSTVLALRKKRGVRLGRRSALYRDIKTHCPECEDPRTTEFLLVLSKGSPSMSVRARAVAGLFKEACRLIALRLPGPRLRR